MKLLAFLFSPQGRVRRFSFVYAWCFISLFVSMASVIFSNMNILWLAPILLWCLTIKRLHDISMSGIYSLIIYQAYGLWGLYLMGLNAVQFMNYSIAMETLMQFMLWPSALCIFYLMIKKGHDGTNEYGIDPTWKLAPRVPLNEFLSWSKSMK